MDKRITNINFLPKVYFGLHMCEGVAEYVSPQVNNGIPYRIFLNDDTLVQMGASFAGRPVYVEHVDEVDHDNMRHEADGYVIESFKNKGDGRHWAKFIVVTKEGQEAIENKHWKLSNAYHIKEQVGGGRWHGVEYSKEIKSGEYEHLAIVPNPRYDESIVLTPEQFKAYNLEKETELLKLANSKDKNKKTKGESMFKIFKKEVVENSADIENMSVTLPKSKVEKTLTQIINEADLAESMKNSEQFANGDAMVEVGDEKMSVNELKDKYENMCKKKKNEEEDEDKKENEEEEDKKENEDEEEEVLNKKKKNEEEDEDKKENEEEEEEEKKSNAFFNSLEKAEKTSKGSFGKIDLSEDKLARGKSRYGSN